mmetsp:Transcript_1630/g.2503  ORF Transcript_1630/g.2503 Transcript_1630/m.2503 type:complete len:234 (-) Transcript_1630:50-751(-)
MAVLLKVLSVICAVLEVARYVPCHTNAHFLCNIKHDLAQLGRKHRHSVHNGIHILNKFTLVAFTKTMQRLVLVCIAFDGVTETLSKLAKETLLRGTASVFHVFLVFLEYIGVKAREVHVVLHSIESAKNNIEDANGETNGGVRLVRQESDYSGKGATDLLELGGAELNVLVLKVELLEPSAKVRRTRKGSKLVANDCIDFRGTQHLHKRMLDLLDLAVATLLFIILAGRGEHV